MTRDVSLGDLIAEWIGAAALGFAGAFAGFAAGGLVGSTLVSAGGTIGGLLLMRRVGERRREEFGFEPAAFEPLDDALLLEDRLEPPPSDSRVVRLFAPATIDPPGALAERIDHWLAGRQSAQPGGHGPQSSPASAALHAALADLKRSLG